MTRRIVVRPLNSNEEALLRKLRLRALEESPDAFGETLADALPRPDEYWADLTRSVTEPGRHAMFLADEGRGPEGLAFGLRDASREDTAHLGGMWVDPGARRSGIGRNLAEAVITWARTEGFATVELWVTEGNGAPVRLYERLGFCGTGQRRTLPSNPSLSIVQMALSL